MERSPTHRPMSAIVWSTSKALARSPSLLFGPAGPYGELRGDGRPFRCRLFAHTVMTSLACGLLAGSAFGAISVGLMVPLQFPDKRAALLGAFLNRFAIGLLIPLA